MSKNISIKGGLAKEILSRFPKHPIRTLAQKLFKENKKVFKDLEDARSHLKYHAGLSGQKALSQLKDVTNARAITRDTNPFKLPESYEQEREPYRIPKIYNNILVISDLHIPYHTNIAITRALEYGKKNKVNCVLINGDLLDFHQLSRFEKDPRKRRTSEEFDAAREFLQILRKTFPQAKIIFLKGNHDLRWEKWLVAKAPEIFDDPEFELSVRLRCGELNIEVLHDNQLIKAGNLTISHGHLIIKGVFAPVNSARGAFLKAKKSILIGHTHKVSEHTETDIDGDIITTWSTGCLCELSPDYNPYGNNYSHGFAHVQFDANGQYTVKNLRIYKGKIL